MSELEALLVPEDQVEAYLDRYNIVVKHLPNGITIVGGNRNIEDAAYTEMDITFPSGAYFDPPDKKGILHVYEHLIAGRAVSVSKRSDGKSNAHTTMHEIAIQAEGVSNPRVLDYGYWPIMPAIYSELVNNQLPNKERLEKEKQEVLSEYAERLARKHVEDIKKFRRRVFYGETNPASWDIDTPEGVRAITVEDIAQLHERILMPEGVYVRVQTQGDMSLLNRVVEDLEDNLVRMPSSDLKPLVFDQALYQRLNPDFKPGEFYLFDSGSKSVMVELNFAWMLPSVSYDSRTWALAKLWPEIGSRFWMRTRERGAGYSAGSLHMDPYDGPRDHTQAVFLYTDIISRDHIEDTAKQVMDDIRSSILETLNDEEIEDLIYRIKRPIEAIPLAVNQRLLDVLQGLKFYGRPIKSEYGRTVLKSVSKEEIKYWRDRLIDEPPAFLVMGDLAPK